MDDVNDKTERRTRDEAARDEAVAEGEERAPARGTAERREGAAPKPGDAARKMRAMFKG